jgi:hypothetical protein
MVNGQCSMVFRSFLIANLFLVCTAIRAEVNVIRTDVNPKTPVFKNEEGVYMLEEGGVYTIRGIVNGDIKGCGDIGVKMEDGTVVNGCVELLGKRGSVSRKLPRIWIDYTCQATINNPGEVALQTGSHRPTFVEYCGTLVVNGNVSGALQLTDGGTTLVVNGDMKDGFAYLDKETWLRVKGTLADGVMISAEFGHDGDEAPITDTYATDGDYKVFFGGTEPEE